MSTTRKRTVSAALLLPLVLFSVVWTSFALWRCQYDGVARARCCCPKDAADQRKVDPAESAGLATITSTACCEIEKYEVDKAPAEAARSASQLAMLSSAIAALPVTLLLPSAPRLPRSVAIWFDDDGPPRGRSLLAQKQALLI
jgi:hypothetical protein